MNPEFLLEDYKIKIDYVKSQYDRLWQRFGFFLSIELALFGFLGYLMFDLRFPEAAALPALLGCSVSVLWYIIGAQDRRLVEIYRERANQAARRFGADPSGLPDYAIDHAGAEVPGGWKGLRSWYSKRLSITQMPATIAIICFVAWLLILFAGRPVAEYFVDRYNANAVRAGALK